jgi:glycosyltransferase involved in cell wall biosynthesis
MTPFLTVLTPTYRRPVGLIACLESVWTQTAIDQIEQVVMVDHIGLGIGGMYQQVPRYAALVRGQYVTWLCDDDTFTSPTIVAELQQAVQAEGEPPLLIVDTIKAGLRWPASHRWPPTVGQIDGNCAVTRADVWHQFVAAYGDRYEGDFDQLFAMAAAGVPAVFCDLLLSIGAVSRGAPERVQ